MPTLPRRLLLLLLLLLPVPFAHGQAYTSILVFGDSLSDTGNVAHLTQASIGVRIPGPPAGYTDGRFTDGKDSLPSATVHTGVWIEQLAATFPAKPAVTASLDGGTNYAFGYAFTGTGTSPLTLTANISVNVDNLGQQVTDYLTVHPTVPVNTLVVVWAGANDLLNASSSAQINTAVTADLTAIQRLISAGATDLLIANQPPLGSIPRLNTTPTAAAATAAAQAFNAGLATGLAALPSANPGKSLNLKPFDVFSLFTSVIASPAANGLANVTGKSQGDVTVNPDTFFFWDDLHPTTTVHHLLAVAAAALVAPPSPSLSAALSPTSVTVASGATATSTITVTPANGYAGTVALTCGSLPANATCALSLASLSFTSSSTAAQTSIVTVSTNASKSATAAFLLLPLSGLGALFALRRRRFNPGLLLLTVILASTSLLGLSGCGGSDKKTPTGTYTIPVTVTPSTGSPTTLNLSLIVQ